MALQKTASFWVNYPSPSVDNGRLSHKRALWTRCSGNCTKYLGHVFLLALDLQCGLIVIKCNHPVTPLMSGRWSALTQSCTNMQISVSVVGSGWCNFVLLCKSSFHRNHKLNQSFSSDIIQSLNTEVNTACIFLDNIRRKATANSALGTLWD